MSLDKVASHKDLIVWQKSMDLVQKVYKITAEYPEDEKFGLVVQMRRAAISIPSNISEGHRRMGNKDALRFMNIAFASGAELETQLEIAKRLGYLRDEQIERLLDEVMKMLNVICSRFY